MSREQIIADIKRRWRNDWWGLMDCDRCSLRTQSYPCDSCARWPQLIRDYGRPLKADGTLTRFATIADQADAMHQRLLKHYDEINARRIVTECLDVSLRELIDPRIDSDLYAKVAALRALYLAGPFDPRHAQRLLERPHA